MPCRRGDRGNITGLSFGGVELSGKQLELLKDLVPGAAPVAALWDPGAPLNWRAAEAAGRARGWKLLSLERPTIYKLSVNRRTATALGLTIPQSLLLRADEVIQ